MKLEKAYKKLLVENPFYGLFLLGLSKILDETIPTSCIRKRGINCEIAINPYYWEELTDSEQLNLLQHEIYHIVFQHMFMWKNFSNHKLFSIAADLETNCYLSNLHEDWVIPSMVGLPEKKGILFYYKNLPNIKEAENLKIYDWHDSWDDFADCSSAEQQLISNQINSQVKNVAEQIHKNRGTIPGEFKTVVQELFKEKPVIFNWKSHLRRMLGSVYDVNVKKTRMRESKRFKDALGLKHKKKVNLLIAVDTSGSVNAQELIDFFSEITHIYKAGAAITILEIDAKIQAKYNFTGKWTGKVHGRGGTNFQPAIDYYRENLKEYTSLIYFTDGCAPIPNNVPNNVIWVITSEGDHKDYPGKTLYIPKSDTVIID